MTYRYVLIVVCVLGLACGSDESAGSTDGGVDGASEEGGLLDAGGDASGDAAPVELDTRLLPMAKPGTRLQPRVFSFEDTPDIFAGWYDSELDIDCQARAAMDGTVRCLPTFAVNPITVRLSDDCTGGSGVLDLQTCGATTYELLGQELSEGLVSCENHGFGTEVTTWTSEPWSGGYSSMDTGECVAYEAAPEGSVSLLSNSEMPADRFVAFTYRFEELDSGLRVRVEESADGASRVMGLYNADGHACSFRPLERGNHYCVPAETAFATVNGPYVDSECTEPLAFVTSNYDEACSGEPKYAIVRREGSDVYSLGEEQVGDDVVYVKDGETCSGRSVTDVKSSAAFIGRLFEVSDTLAELPRVLPIALGEGAVRSRFYATPQGVVAHETYDEVFSFMGSGLRARTAYGSEGEGCIIWETRENGVRCLPAHAALDVLEPRFSDDACTERVGYVGTWTTLTEQDPELVFDVEQTECEHPQGANLRTTEMVSNLWRVTGKIDAGSQPIYELAEQECLESDVGDENAHYTLEALDISAYPQPTEVTLAP